MRKLNLIQSTVLTFFILLWLHAQASAQIIELTCPLSVKIDGNHSEKAFSVSTVLIALGRNNVHSIEPGATNIERNLGIQLNNLMVINDSVFGKGYFFEGQKKTDIDSLSSSLNINNSVFSGIYQNSIGIEGSPVTSVNTRIVITRSTGKIFATKTEVTSFPAPYFSHHEADGTCDIKTPGGNKF